MAYRRHLNTKSKRWSRESLLTSYYELFKKSLENKHANTLNFLLKKSFYWAETFPTFLTYISKIIYKYEPLFFFKVRKVDKKVQKYSRGKAGKFSLVWGYAKKKQKEKIVLSWLKKEFKMQKGLTWLDRLTRTIFLSSVSPESTFLAKIRRFVHNFAFKKYKKNLVRGILN